MRVRVQVRGRRSVRRLALGSSFVRLTRGRTFVRLKWHSAYSTPFRDKTLSVQSLKFVQVPVPFVYLSPFRSLFESARARDGRVQYSQLSMQDVSSLVTIAI